MMPVVILCGGLGTRLGDLTAHHPKSLVPVNGTPFLIHQLQLLRRHGIEDVFLLVHHFAEQLVTGWDRALVRPLRAHCIRNEWRPLGTAGAVRAALAWLPESFFTLYGDSYLECDYATIADQFRALGILGLRTEWQGIDYGLSAFHRRAFEAPGRSIPELHESLRLRYQLTTVTMPERFYEMGSPAGLALLSAHLAAAPHSTA